MTHISTVVFSFLFLFFPPLFPTATAKKLVTTNYHGATNLNLRLFKAAKSPGVVH